MKLGINVPMGPFELLDYVGPDNTLHILSYMEQELDPMFKTCPWLKELVDEGRLGRKVGQGVYDYSR